MITINAYLTFNGNCRDAMTFYKECLGGDLKFQTVKGSPMESHWPDNVQNNILHASLTKNKLILLGSDMVESDGFITGNNVSLTLNCSTENEIQTIFSKLSVEGKVKYPLHNFYDGKIGSFKDKFGINWLLKL